MGLGDLGGGSVREGGGRVQDLQNQLAGSRYMYT